MYHHSNGNSPSSPESVSSYGGSPGPSTVIQTTMMPIFHQNPCIMPIRAERLHPHLVILNQPQSKFRFRYASEMTGTHGCLMAESRDRNKKECIRVQLYGCMESEAIIRCTLVTSNKDPVPHVHKLGGDGQNVTNDGEYQDIVVSASKNDWIATFSGLTIIHTAKKMVRDVVAKRLRHEKGGVLLNRAQDQQLVDEADKIAITMDLHSVRLKFQAFLKRHDRLEPITPPEYSQAIHNLKSTHAGDLRIVRIDKVYSCCTGQEEIFIFVEKVNKKDIKIKFFETDDNDEETWSAYADFSELDVHHQYAIAFKTPPYKDQNIEEAVNVWFQLYRPSNGSTSAPKAFTYTPRETVKRKQPNKRIVVSDPYDSVTPIPRPPASEQPHKQVQQIQPAHAPQTGNGTHQGVVSRLPFHLDGYNGFNVKMEDYSFLFQSTHGVPQQMSMEHCWPSQPIVQIDSCQFDINHYQTHQNPDQYVPAQDDITMSLDDTALSDLAELLETNDWHSYEGSLSADACVAAESSQTKPKIKTNSDILPAQTPAIVDSSLTKTTMLNNYILRVATAIRMHSGNLAQNINHFMDLLAMEDDNGDNALHCALTHGQLDVVQHILKIIPNNDDGLRFINAFNYAKLTPLHICVMKNLADLIPSLLLCRANPFLPNNHGDTAIHLAAAKKHCEDGLKYLLDKCVGEDMRMKLNKRNYSGYSPLHLAIKDNNLRAVQLLLTHGSNVNLIEVKSGKTALHLAVQQRSEEIVMHLINQPTLEINAQSYDGNTALHLAVTQNLSGICKLLSSKGADPEIVNYVQQSNVDDAEAPLDHSFEEDSASRRGTTAFDMATLNASVMEILTSKDMSIAKDITSPTASDTNTDPGFDISGSREHSKKLSSGIIKELASFLDSPYKGWEKLADSLDLLSSVRIALDKQPSPTTYLLSNLDLWEIPSHVILEKLRLLQLKQAAKLLEDYLGL